MQWFLLLIIIGLCGGGYYEYTQIQQTEATQQAKIDDGQKKNDDLTAQNKKLQDTNTALTKTSSDQQGTIADLTTQLQTVQSTLSTTETELAAAKKTIADAVAKKLAEVKAAAAVAANPNDLGTITTLDGKTYQNCTLLKLDTDGITFSYTGGITKVTFGLLPPDVQKRVGYDPHQAAKDAANALYQEQQRQAQVQATGN